MIRSKRLCGRIISAVGLLPRAASCMVIARSFYDGARKLFIPCSTTGINRYAATLRLSQYFSLHNNTEYNMASKLLICPFCDDGRAFKWGGLLLHVKAKHPDKLTELKENKAMYLAKFACDEVGNPLESSPEPVPPAADPTPPADLPKESPQIKKAKPSAAPAPEVTPPSSPTPPKKETPAEGGMFRRIRKGLFG